MCKLKRIITFFLIVIHIIILEVYKKNLLKINTITFCIQLKTLYSTDNLNLTHNKYLCGYFLTRISKY